MHLQSVRELNEMENLRLEASESGRDGFGQNTLHSEAKRPTQASENMKFASYPERSTDPRHFHDLKERRRNGVESALNEMNMSGLTNSGMHKHTRYLNGI